MTKKTEQSATNNDFYSEHRNSQRQILQALYQKFSTDIWPEVMNNVANAGNAGISEFELLKLIDKKHNSAGISINFANPHALFPIHFLLFHHLYTWHRQLSESNATQTLIISPLAIQLLNKQSRHQVGEYDTLGAYYLDLENFYTTTNEELDNMLTNFWSKFCAFDEMGEAFNTLGLAPTKDLKAIKRHYQKQMATHHPDKGGCSQRAQEINNAYHAIKKAIEY